MKKTLSLGLLMAMVLLLALVASPVFGGNHGDHGNDYGDDVERAKRAQEKHTRALMANPNIVGTGVGLNSDGQAVIRVFTQKAGVPVPHELEGVRVQAVVTGMIVAQHHCKGRHASYPGCGGDGGTGSPPTASFTVACTGLDCDFTNTSTDSGGGWIAVWSWDFGDGNTSTAQDPPIHSYSSGRTYSVVLTVTDNDGGTDSATEFASASANCYVGITDERCARPVPIGVSTGHPSITAGTIGMRLLDDMGTPDTADDVYYALSNNHVYAVENTANIGDDLLQQGAYDGGMVPHDVIGSLRDFEPIVFNDSAAENIMDAAIALVTTGDVGEATPADGYGTPSTTTMPATLDLPVQKYGRTTGHTFGTVSEINVIISVCYEAVFPFFCTKSARFVDQFTIVPSNIPGENDFSAGGDSGSLIVTHDENKNPVGLLFAGSTARTIANPIGPVLYRFMGGGSGSGGSPPTGTVVAHTEAITPVLVGGKRELHDTHLIHDADGNPVAGATVSSQLTLPDGTVLNASGLTDDDGKITFRLPFPPWKTEDGTYTIEDINVEKDGLTFDKCWIADQSKVEFTITERVIGPVRVIDDCPP